MSSAILLFFILFIEFFAICCSVKAVNTTFGCTAGERKALLRFRESFSDPYSTLSSWKGEDCCTWLGIRCDKFTGHVISLDLGNKDLQGKTLDSSLLELKHLSYLDLSGFDFQYNSFPAFIGSMKQLQYLNLSLMSFHGVVPHNLGNLSSLRVLDLSRIDDLIVDDLAWISRLSSLEHLDLSYVDLSPTKDLLKFIGRYSFWDHFAKLSKLSDLRLSSFKFKVKLDWVPPFQLRWLVLESCDIGGQFPQWVQMQKELGYLYMENCSISDTLSNSLYKYKNMFVLFLSNNHIQGPIPNNISQMLPSLLELQLDQNSINGSLPDSLCEMTSLIYMDISRNHLSGNLPECLGNLRDLMGIGLSSNEISGVIPNSISGAYLLEYLKLNNNSLTGKLPFTMKNCTNLIVVDIGENKFLGKLPKWIGNYLPDLRLLRLRNNKFYGQIPFEVCQLLKLQMLDLANNNLTGGIPNCFGNLSGMVPNSNYHYDWVAESFTEVLKGLELEYSSEMSRFLVNLDVSNNNLVGKIPWELTRLSDLIGLNLSHNHLVGEIPELIGDMKSVESLDLSNNNLSGTIPSSLSDLSFISHLNLSNNNLSGKIPTGRQLQTLDYPSIYEGNPRLCGAPLPKKCEEGSMVQSIMDNHVAANEGDNIIDDKVLLSIVIICGFATGFWGVIGFLVINKRWRQAYFEFAEERIIRRLFGG
ncbi:hypothetical protein RD792_006376 [Penstemon davidsonii]|uniref:Leucine-rich repeat-containing N-terminal plant-type domain-containing protein n=1 Tax=Penstemon davidsonii TaxID=160366 RepID=A0ABR0DDX3_9LAMI|nr:hypothetical protein RD792_006376 [Penstemon davidsonii]